MVLHSNTLSLDYNFNILNTLLHYVSTSRLIRFLEIIEFPTDAKLFPLNHDLSTFESTIPENVSKYHFLI